MKRAFALKRNDFYALIFGVSIFMNLIFLPVFFLPFKGINDMYSEPRYIFLLLNISLLLFAIALNPSIFLKYIEFKNANVLIIIYIIFLTVSLSYSINIKLSLFGFSIWRDGYIVQLIFIMLYFFSQLLDKISKKLFEYIILSGTIVSIYGIAQSFGFDFIREYNPNGLSVYSTMYNQNFLGTYLVLILPLAFHMVFSKGKNLFLIPYCIMFYTLLETTTRGAWLGFFVSITFYLVVYRIKFGINKLDIKKIIFILSLSLVLLILFDIRNDGVFTSRFLSIFIEANSFVIGGSNVNKLGSNRGYIWMKAIEYIRLRPLFGYGIQNIVLHFLADHSGEMELLFGEVMIVNNVHNEYLQIALSTGIPSLIIYLVFVFRAIVVGIKKINLNVKYLVIVSSIVGYLVQAFFSLSFISVAYIFWIFLGILVNKNNILKDEMV